MASGGSGHEGPPTSGQLFALGLITAAFPTFLLFVAQFNQAPSGSITENAIFALQELGADSAVILIGASFFFAVAGDLIISRGQPVRWHKIIALGASAGLLLLLIITQGNQVRSNLQHVNWLLGWTFFQGAATIISLVYGAILKSMSHGG